MNKVKMGGLTEKPTFFSVVVSPTPWNGIKIF